MKVEFESTFLHNILNNCKILYDKNTKNVMIKGISDLSSAKKNYITFFSNLKYLKQLNNTKASAIIISKKNLNLIPKKIIPIYSSFPEVDFAKIVNLFFPNSYFSKISYKNLDLKEVKKKFKSLKFGINFYLENNVKIGKNVLIGNNVTIKSNSIIGNNVIIGSNVVIENSTIEDNVHICDGTIIGKKGFGFKFINDNCLRIPHIGKVIIKKGCELGSCCVIDRGSYDDTVIGNDTFLDNFVHIAHNVKIGSRCILAAQVGVAGSTIIGNNVIIGGQSGISGHLKIGNNVKIGGKSGVVKNIEENITVMGYPAKPFKEFIKDTR